MNSEEEALKCFLRRRGVETPCATCRGLGTRVYGSTSTWRGGLGGAAMTSDVCDKCWGSGDADREWANLRRLRSEEDARVAERAGDLIGARCGVGLRILLPGLEELCNELDKFERQRRKRPYGFDTVARCLASVLREAIAAKHKITEP